MPMNPSAIGAPEFLDTRRKEGVPPQKREPSPLVGTAVNGVSGSISGRRRESDSVPPLFCTLVRKDDGTRFVTVAEGAVSEVIPMSTGTGYDSIQEHAITNIWTAGLLTEHGPVASGGVVGIAFDVDENGFVDGNCTIEVRAAADAKSTHYTPPVGSDTDGAPGTAFIALCKLTGAGDSERLEILANAAIHFHDTPAIGPASGDADVFKKYDIETGKYLTRGITGGLGITVTENEDDIEIKESGSGWWGEITIYFTPTIGSTQDLTVRVESGKIKQVFLGGSEVGGNEGIPGVAVFSVVDTDT